MLHAGLYTNACTKPVSVAVRPAITLSDWRRAFVQAASPDELLHALRQRLASRSDDPAIIRLVSVPELDAQLATLSTAAQARGDRASVCRDLPLFGVPFAVKDNIDVAGLPTTAACPAFALRRRARSAGVVRAPASRPARSASARPTSTSSPPASSARARPTARRAACFAADRISGGSSSGSAVAVGARRRAVRARHRHGRLGPRAGRLQQHRRPEADAGPRRHQRRRAGLPQPRLRLDLRADRRRRRRRAGLHRRAPTPATPSAASRPGRGAAAARCASACRGAATSSATPATRPACEHGACAQLRRARPPRRRASTSRRSHAVAELLYDGPWVAERHAVVEALLERRSRRARPDGAPHHRRGAHRIQRRPTPSAASTRLRELRGATRAALWRAGRRAAGADARPAIRASPRSTPIRSASTRNSAATPTSSTCSAGARSRCRPACPPTALPFGVTFIAPARRAMPRSPRFGRAWQRALALPLGATGARRRRCRRRRRPRWPASEADVAAGRRRRAPRGHAAQRASCSSAAPRCSRRRSTAPHYRLYALPGTVPPKPGLVRVAEAPAHAIAVEVWAMPRDAVGTFLALIPAPLGLGSARAGRRPPRARLPLRGARRSPARADISAFGGWRAYLAAAGKP